MRIHLIATGGAVMHNLAIALHLNQHEVSGSDDEIYNPARDRLAAHGLLPKKEGWYPDKITNDVEIVILGMHARKDNLELLKAQELGIPVYSFPEFIFRHSQEKKRIVVAGSHGKTTTTAMIMHVLRYHELAFDYLVGAQLEGFETMVQLSDAPIIIIEGDEYLSSPIDRRPKFLHYRPHIAILTGIAWDHVNVFPTFERYYHQFELFLEHFEKEGTLIFYEPDSNIQKLVKNTTAALSGIPYNSFQNIIKNGITYIKRWGDLDVPLQIFGAHNLSNLQAAYHVCKELEIEDAAFFEAIESFAGAAKRLQLRAKTSTCSIWQDFAHAPSKVKATVEATKNQYPNRKLVACVELHTFSSLSKNFLPQYRDALQVADVTCVFYSPHTLKMKKLPDLSPTDIQVAFGQSNLKVFTELTDFQAFLETHLGTNTNFLMMSSGNFGGLNWEALRHLLESKDATSN